MGRTQRQIAETVAAELGLSQRMGLAFLEKVIDIVADDLVDTKRVELRGLGVFTVHHRPEHHTTHPKTGKPITIRACDEVEYRSSVGLRRKLNQDKPKAPGAPEVNQLEPSPNQGLGKIGGLESGR